jgi:hypothetical protein
MEAPIPQKIPLLTFVNIEPEEVSKLILILKMMLAVFYHSQQASREFTKRHDNFSLTHLWSQLGVCHFVTPSSTNHRLSPQLGMGLG